MVREELLFNMSKQILKRIGESGLRSIGTDYDGDDTIVSCMKYRYDKLCICDNGQYVSIWYDEELVFDSKDALYIPGSWEMLLTEIYKALDILEQEKKKKDDETEKGREFCNKYVESYKYSDYESKKIYKKLLADRDIVVSIECKTEDYFEKHDYYEYYKIYKNKSCVLSASRVNYAQLRVDKFLSGQWVKEFIDIDTRVKEIIKQRIEMAKEEDIQNSIKRLRKKFYNH